MRVLSILITLFSFLSLLVLSGPAFLPSCVHAAQPDNEFRSTDLPLPRFVTLKADKVYARTGPALKYPLKWVYKRENMPVEIVQEFDSWRKVRDFEGGEGWVHRSLLSGERTAMVIADQPVEMREAPGALSRVTALVEPLVIVDPQVCEQDWCRVEVDGYKGWVERNSLWGVYETENLN